MARSTIGTLTMVIAFAVGLLGSATALILFRVLSSDKPVPIVMNSDVESQYPHEYRSFLEVGSRFPEETCLTPEGYEQSIHSLSKAGPTVLFLSSPACEACLEQDSLWSQVMRPALMSDVLEVLCLPLHYKDSTIVSERYTRERKIVYFDDERFREVYHFVIMPTIISLDGSGFITAIQYGYTGTFTEDLIEAVTKYQVGPAVRTLRMKSAAISVS